MGYKVICTAKEAAELVSNDASILVGGHGTDGIPENLVKALLNNDVFNLSLVTNALTEGTTEVYDATCLLNKGMVRKLVTSMNIPKTSEGQSIKVNIDVELVPEGTLLERIRVGGAGLGGFFIPTGIGSGFADGKDIRNFDDQECTLETPIKTDFAFIRAHKADLLGNLVYKGVQRNCNPIMATAAKTTIVEVDEIVDLGELDPETIITQGIYIHHIVLREFTD